MPSTTTFLRRLKNTVFGAPTEPITRLRISDFAQNKLIFSNTWMTEPTVDQIFTDNGQGSLPCVSGPALPFEAETSASEVSPAFSVAFSAATEPLAKLNS